MTNPWLNQPDCDPFPTEGATTVSDRERIIDQMLEAGEVIRTWQRDGVDEMRLRTRREMAEDMCDEVVAPLLVEAERRGAERAWQEVRESVAVDMMRPSRHDRGVEA